MSVSSAAAEERMYFTATDNITNVLVQKINAETVRIDMSVWHLTEHSITTALLNRFRAGVQVRLLGDRVNIFESNPITRREIYSLANEGVPIRVRFNPTWYPEIQHWKATIFAGQNLVTFGSANYTPFELAPVSPTNYKDETVVFSDDPIIVNAVKTKFDRIWNDTTREPEGRIPGPPYFKDWNDACAMEPTGNCADYPTLYPNPAPMIIDTARLEPDNPLPPELVWGQGPSFNNRLTQEINREPTLVQLVIYRLTVENITTALIEKWRAGVPVQVLIEPQEYLHRLWPEYWLTHANVDKMWAAGVPIKQRAHTGLTHMKTLVTSAYATNASSNYAAAWQRDINQFIPSASKPALYQAVKDRVTAMWNNPAEFGPFQPQPPDAATLEVPVSGGSEIPPTTPLVWKRAAFAVSYDVYVGTSQSNMILAANVPALLVNDPPTTYSWTPPATLEPGTKYFWKIVSRTNATPVNPSMIATSAVGSFTTAGPPGPPVVPASPTPSDNATGVGTTPTLGWSAGAVGTTFDVAFGTTNPPPTVANGLTSPLYATGSLAPNTSYYWRVTAVSSGGSTAGPIWSFTTGSGGGAATDIVIYAADVSSVQGSWRKVADSSAAAGIKLTNPDAGVGVLAEPLASPTNYFDVQFQANAGTRYRVWMRVRATGDSKWNDSVFVQFSDSVNSSGNPIYRMGTTGSLMVNLWACATCQSFGWGWQRNAYWLADTGDVWFQNTGPHTLRVQIREDGSDIDQIVLSPTTYSTNAPGPVSDDTTIVPKPTQAPAAPGSPSPANGETEISVNATLTWSAAAATSYDVAFGTANPPPVVVSGQTTASYTPPPLTEGATYFWRITARNSSASTTGLVWSFTTVAAAPATPSSPNPADGATGVATNVTLKWTAAGATTYDILLDTSDPPTAVASGITTASYTPSGLVPGTTYIWQIVAHNSRGTNQGPQWIFTTAATPAPGVPATPSPAPGATGVSRAPTLTWSAAGATSYDIRFGTSNPPPHVFTKTTASYTPVCECSEGVPTPLAYSTTYFWQITARNAGGTTEGPIWSVTTMANPNPPSSPFSPNPADGATGVSRTATLSWSAQNTTSFDVRFGTTDPPPQVVTGQAGASYSPSMAATTTYFWQVVAHNANGTTEGAVWSFTTAPSAPPPPGAPSSPVPINGATNVGVNGTLSWTGGGGATSYDVHFGTTSQPPYVASVSGEFWTAPTRAAGTTYFWQVVARNSGGSSIGPVWSFTTAGSPPDDIVIYASDIPAAALHGSWATASDGTSPNGVKLVTPDNGFSSTDAPLAAPTHYIDVPFTAQANTAYTLWLRVRALNDSKWNDSLWVQFSDARSGGAPLYPIGTTSALNVNLATDATATSLNGWGWQNSAYWLSQPAMVTFSSSGTHTLRIQLREDGVQLDQIVLSPTTYLNTRPGSLTDDSTIVPKP
jgi:hypothetical protein